jgi:hypothetical protein
MEHLMEHPMEHLFMLLLLHQYTVLELHQLMVQLLSISTIMILMEHLANSAVQKPLTLQDIQ